MSCEVKDFILKLEGLIEKKSPLVEDFRSSKLVLKGLRELDEMVEIDDVKTSIVQQLQLYIVGKQRKTNDKQVLNSVISGPPGVGKTSIAKILGKIWSGMGILKPLKKEERSQVTTTMNQKLISLERENKELKDRIEQSKVYSKHLCSTMDNHRRRIMQMKSVENPTAPEYKKGWVDLLNETRDLRLTSDLIINSFGIKCQIKDEEIDEVIPFIELRREDCVASCIGHSAQKTTALLDSAIGGVVFFDEAYSLVAMDSERDFGHEVVTVIMGYMDKYPENLAFIFSGYKHLMDKTIFSSNPGLLRRITFFYEVKGYTSEGLKLIFLKQISDNKWNISPNINLIDFFNRFKERFRFYGGDTLKLSMYAKLAYANVKFNMICQNEEEAVFDNTFTTEMLERAMKVLVSYQTEGEEKTVEHLYI